MPRPGTAAIFGSFLRLGITAFGGPAMVAHIKEMSVKRNGWLTEETFKDGVVICQSMPGATAMQMAAYVGLRVAGVRGAIASYAGFGLPAFLLMLTLAVFYSGSRELPLVVSLFQGLQVMVVAIVANATFRFGRDVGKKPEDLVLAGVAAALFWFVGANAPAAFLAHFTVFVLACFVGYMVVWNVTPALHTPLMSVTNAISSIIAIGALVQVGPEGWIRWLAVAGIALTAVNMFGGFAVTRRMLSMFRK